LLARDFPRMNIVIGHFGNLSGNVINAMQQYRNLYLETSIMGSTPYTIQLVADRVGADRILFGSDVPYSDQLVEILKVTRSNLKTVDKERILYHNAARLLGI